MSRYPFLLIALILAVGYLVSLSWFGSKFFSYARENETLSLQKHEKQRLLLGDVVTLELQGSGFDKATRVQMHLDVNNQDAIVGTFPLESTANDLLLEDDLLFLATAKNGLQIFDIRNPTSPKLTSQYLPRVAVLDIEKSGSYYILSCAAQGIYIYQKSANDTLKLIKRLYTLGAAIESRVVGGFLYVAAGKKGLQVYDLENSDDDRPINVVDAGGLVTGIETYEERLYLATNSAGLQVYQVKTAGNLLYLGNIQVDEKVRDVKRYRNKLYLLESNKLSLYRLGRSPMPELLDSQVVSGNSHYLHITGEILYVSDSYSGVNQIAISRSGDSRLIGYIDVGGIPRAMASRGHYLYVAASKSSLRIIDQRSILPRQVVLAVAMSNVVSDLFIRDRWLYVAARNEGLLLSHLGPRDQPLVQLGKGICRSFAVFGDLLYAERGADGLEVFSIENPAAPKRIAYWPELKSTNDFARIGQYLVLAKGSHGLALVDVSDFSRPLVTDTIADSYALRIDIKDGLIFVAGEKSGVSILRISAQGRFEKVGEVVLPFPLNSFSEAYDLKVKEGIAYIANGHGGLLIADVSDPQQPRIISSVGLPGIASSLVLEGERVYISCRNSGLQIVDVSDLNSPRLETGIGISGLTSGVQIVDGMIFLANGYSGVIALPVPQQIKNFKVLTAEKLRVTLPSPKAPGRYSLQVNNREQSASLDGVVRYTTDM